MSASRAEPASPLRIALDGTVAAGDEVLLVCDDRAPFALTGEWAGGGALVGSEPVELAGEQDDPFELIGSHPPVVDPSSDFVGGGWFGYLGYRLAGTVERQQPAPPARGRLPAFVLARYDHLLRMDARGRWCFEALVTPAREGEILGRLDILRARLRSRPARARRPAATSWRSEPTPSGHVRAVAACRERIAAGDLFQANLSLRIRSSDRGDPVQLFAHATSTLAPARAAYLSGDWGAIASLSPELYLERRGRSVRSAPIKGTRPRGLDEAADAAARDELACDAKDRAENVMIVDLVRNDLGRVCEHGTVEVAALARPVPRTGVWHLESEVRGELAQQAGDAELLRASFPPGSVTGAPKVAAIDVISELESAERQCFTGAIGFSSPCAGLQLSVAIRTFESDGRRLWLDVGGAIVADSDPESESREALAKAAPLLDAIGGQLELPGPAGPGPAPARRKPRPLPRPSPDAGIFETLLFDGEELLALPDHLRRIRASARELYGMDAPAALLAKTALAVAEKTGAACRVRLVLEPDGRIEAETAPLPDPDQLITLAPVCVPGGIGPYKLADRRLLDALSAEKAPAVPLLCDLDGDVLEAAWASVFVVARDGTLATPPTDGRILPGVTRAKVIERAHALDIAVAQRSVSLTELEAASEVLITSALRDVKPVGDAGAVGQALRTAAASRVS